MERKQYSRPESLIIPLLQESLLYETSIDRGSDDGGDTPIESKGTDFDDEDDGSDAMFPLRQSLFGRDEATDELPDNPFRRNPY